jgi:hypothetical protein
LQPPPRQSHLPTCTSFIAVAREILEPCDSLAPGKQQLMWRLSIKTYYNVFFLDFVDFRHWCVDVERVVVVGVSCVYQCLFKKTLT